MDRVEQEDDDGFRLFDNMLFYIILPDENRTLKLAHVQRFLFGC